MYLKRKIKAFTLSEIIVVMLLTIIVIGLAFSVLTLIKKQMLLMENNFSKKTKEILF